MKLKFIITIFLLSFVAVSAGAQDSLRTATLKVGNLHCDGDMPAIKKRLLNQDGIDEVRFGARTGERSEFTVIYHSAATDERAIRKAIETTPGCDDQGETPYRVIQERKRKPAGS